MSRYRVTPTNGDLTNEQIFQAEENLARLISMNQALIAAGLLIDNIPTSRSQQGTELSIVSSAPASPIREPARQNDRSQAVNNAAEAEPEIVSPVNVATYQGPRLTAPSSPGQEANNLSTGSMWPGNNSCCIIS